VDAAAAVPSQQRIHTYEARLTRLVLDYVANRLSLPETPLDHHGDKAAVDEILAGLVTRQGMDPQLVLGIYADHLSKTVRSADSPRFFAFIPVRHQHDLGGSDRRPVRLPAPGPDVGEGARGARHRGLTRTAT